jgi:ATP-dependent Zn protease
MIADARRGTAYHETGHAIVAIALGLRVAKVEIDLDGDPTRGEMTLDFSGPNVFVSLPDGLSICEAGRAAENLFDAHTHSEARLMDRYQAEMLLAANNVRTEYWPSMRRAGYRRAAKHLNGNRALATRIAEYLIAHSTIDRDAMGQLLA